MYGAARCKYGVELVDRINEESVKFSSPILFAAAADDALLAQIVRCKGRMDLPCISCLKELLSLMRKDEAIARYVYHLPAHSYQGARFTDWFRPYIEEQLHDSKGSASAAQHFKNKCDLLTKAAAHLDALQPLFAEYEKEQVALLDKCLTEGGVGFTDLAGHWAGTDCDEVIKHFPPQLIVGKQVADDREVFVYDSDPLVRLEIFELDCEYAYSAPTGLFNLQLPHIEMRTSLYRTESYSQYKKAKAAEAAKEKAEKEPQEGDSGQTTVEADGQTAESEKEKEPEKDCTRDWDKTKREAPILLKIVLTNKTEDKDLKVWYRLGLVEGADREKVNVTLPSSTRKTYLYSRNQKIIETLLKIDPTKPGFLDFADVEVELEARVRNEEGPSAATANVRQVHYAAGSHDVAVGGSPQNLSDGGEDDRDDSGAYAEYQSRPRYTGFEARGHAHENEAMIGLLNLQPQQLEDGDADEQSNDSTNAVAGGAEGERAAGGGPDGGDDLPGAGGSPRGARCEGCSKICGSGDFTCPYCGHWVPQD